MSKKTGDRAENYGGIYDKYVKNMCFINEATARDGLCSAPGKNIKA